jgi:ribosomal protein L3
MHCHAHFALSTRVAPILQSIEAELEELKAQCKVIRVLVHTQIKKVSNWGQKKAHMLEVQVSRRACFNPPESACCNTEPSYTSPTFASQTSASHLPGGHACHP